MSNNVEENQTIWKNTMSEFINQFTRMDKLFVEAKSCAIDLADPSHNMNGKEAKKLVEPLQRKLELVNNYINSLHKVLPLAAVTYEEGQYSVERLSATLDECMEQAKGGNLELTAFLEAIEVWELHAVKDSKKQVNAGGAVGDTVGHTKAPEIKG